MNLESLMTVMRFATNRGRSHFTLQSLPMKLSNQSIFTETIDEQIKDLNAMIPKCFMKKFESDEESLTEECDLFKPTVTDMGICPTFNSVPLRKIMKPSYFLESFYKAYEEDFSPYDFIKFGEDFGQSLNFYLASNPVLPAPNLIKRAKPTNFHVSIESVKEFFGMKSHSFTVKAGYKTTLNIEPMEIVASNDLKGISVSKRQCRFDDETEDLTMLNNYTQSGCVFEHQMKEVFAKCQCVPWFIPTLETNYSICDVYGNKCYESVLKHSRELKNCPPSCNLVQFSKSLILEKIDHEAVCEESTSWSDISNYRFGNKGLKLLFKYLTVKEWTANPNPNETYDEDQARIRFCQYMAKNHIAEVQVKFANKKYIRTKMGVKVSFTDRLREVLVSDFT